MATRLSATQDLELSQLAGFTKRLSHASLRSDAGYFYLKSGELEQAEKQFIVSRNLAKGHPKTTVTFAILRAKQERFAESLELFKEVLMPAAAHSNLGVILAKSGKQELAIEHFEEARRLDPSLPAPPAFLKYFQKD